MGFETTTWSRSKIPAVRATQFVETLNTSYQVFDKTSGPSVFGPVEIDALWTGFGGFCDPSSLANQTDLVVIYDKLAIRSGSEAICPTTISSPLGQIPIT
jgi:hypothetical protein